MAVICLGASIAPLDFSVNIAFPAMTQAFSLDTQGIRWVAICYMLSYGGLMLLFGSIGDRVGHLKIFRWGLMLGALAFLLCAVAPSFRLLLVGRVIQGVATALTVSCAPALVLRLFADHRRTWALSRFGAYFALAAAIAPVMGGLMTGLMGWPGVYWFRIPLIVFAWFSLRYVNLSEHDDETRQRHDVNFSAWSVLSQVASQNNNFLWINISSFVVQWSVFTVPLLVPYFCVQQLGWTYLQCGLLLGLWASGTVAGSFLAPRFTQATKVELVAYLSAWITSLSVCSIALWSQNASILLIGGSLLSCGLGLGVYQVAYADLVVAALPRSSRGVAGSLTQVTRTIGVIVGAFTWLWIFSQLLPETKSDGHDSPQAFMLGFRAVFLISPAFAVAFLAISALKPGLWFKEEAAS
jgi:MFS family permease